MRRFLWLLAIIIIASALSCDMVGSAPPENNIAPASIFPEPYRCRLCALCAELKVPEIIAYRLITYESGWDENSVTGNPNGTYDYGLMKLNSRYIAYFSEQYMGGSDLRPLNPDENLTAGMRHLRRMYDLTGDWYSAICAYNCGLTRFRRGNLPESTVRQADYVMGVA